jgi:carbon storage regulator
MHACGAGLFHFSTKEMAMLILTRRVGEMIKIGLNVEVTVMAVNGNQVRIGVKAPKTTIVDREEIAVRRRENPVFVR